MATQINLDTSQRVDITCRRGDTFSLRLTLTDATDPSLGSFLATDSFLMQVRDADTNDTATVIDVAPVTGVDPTATTHIEFTVAASVMKDVLSGLYVYDIEQETDTGVVVTLIYGTFKVNEDVSITTE